ncbi:unnamed protein product [Urochloa humidicola]
MGGFLISGETMRPAAAAAGSPARKAAPWARDVDSHWRKVWGASSPRREWSSPSRHQVNVSRDRIRKPLFAGTRGAREFRQVATADSSSKRVQAGNPTTRDGADPSGEGAIQEFFGQLWFVPDPAPSRGRVRRGETTRSELVWIRKEKLESGDFAAQDCFPIGQGDTWDREPLSLNFAERIWGKGEKLTFIQAVKISMASRGRGGRNQRPRSPEEWEGWQEEGNRYQYPPPPPSGHYPPPPQFYQAPPPYGYYHPAPPPVHHPPPPPPHSFERFHQGGQGPRPRGHFQGGRGRPVHQQMQKPQQADTRPRNSSENRDQQKPVQENREPTTKGAGADSKFSQVICYKCGEAGHYSTACAKPKVCFICYDRNHVVECCPEWQNSHQAVQCFGSANKGLGFYHVDVAQRPGRFRHWAGFENFGVFTVEEGSLTEEEIIKSLKQQFDKEWDWKLMKLEDYRFLVRFPTSIKVESKAIGKATYFYLKNDTAMASLRVWNGDIEPVGQLVETWVVIKGIPPKWADWITIKGIASSLGKLLEVDWQTLFNSFFSVVRVRINCKDPNCIPRERVMEMGDQLFLLEYIVEGEQEGGKPREDDQGDDPGSEDDLLDEEEPEAKGDQSSAGTGEKTPDQEKGKSSGPEMEKSVHHSQRQQSVNQAKDSITKRLEEGMIQDKESFPNCVNLLQALELTDSDAESAEKGETGAEEEEMSVLPDEWVQSELIQGWEEAEHTREDPRGRRKKEAKKKQWGPVVAERKSKRILGDNRPATEKAQDMKRKWEGSSKEEFGDSSEESCRFGSELDNSVPSRQARRALGSYFEAEANSVKTGETPQLTLEDLSMECWSQQIHNMEKLMKKEKVILTI